MTSVSSGKSGTAALAADPSPSCICGAPLVRGNTSCLRCGSLTGYLPDRGWLLAFTLTRSRVSSPFPTYSNPLPTLTGRTFKPCRGRTTAHQCNWMINATDPATQCLSWSLTRTTPDLTRPGATDRWAGGERAKRQTISLPPLISDSAVSALIISRLPELLIG